MNEDDYIEKELIGVKIRQIVGIAEKFYGDSI